MRLHAAGFPLLFILGTLAGDVLAAPLAAEAQPMKVPRVGFFGLGSN